MFIPIGLLESYIGILLREQCHVSPWTPPGLGRTQGCGFWADIQPAHIRQLVAKERTVTEPGEGVGRWLLYNKEDQSVAEGW